MQSQPWHQPIRKGAQELGVALQISCLESRDADLSAICSNSCGLPGERQVSWTEGHSWRRTQLRTLSSQWQKEKQVPGSQRAY